MAKNRKFTTITLHLDGNTYKKNIAYRTAAELAEKRSAFESECKRKLKPNFRFVAECWQEEHEKEVQHYTADCYIAPVKDLIEHFGDTLISDITSMMVQSFLNDMGKMGYARHTINLRKMAMSQIMDYAIFHGHIIFNPVTVCKIPKQAKTSKRTPTSAEDIKKIESLPPSMWKNYCMLLMYTGIRREEALALEKSDFDFENRTVSINKVVVFENNHAVLRHSTKSQAGTRLAPFPSKLHPLFENTPEGIIFANNEGYMTKSAFDKGFRKFQRENDLHCTSHQFRHFFATACHGVIDAKDAQHLLGHSNIETTLNIYTEVEEQKRQDAINKLDSFFSA